MSGTLLRAVFTAVFAVAMQLALAGSAAAAKRVALVIGNDQYSNIPQLRKAVNDARTMNDTLKKLGFTVLVAENQNRKGLERDDARLRPHDREGRHRVLLLRRPRLRDRRRELPAADRRAVGDRRPGRADPRRRDRRRAHHHPRAEPRRRHGDLRVRRLPQQSVRAQAAPARCRAAAASRR